MIFNIILKTIVIILILIPAIAGFFWPKETFLFGNRWRYNEEPEISDLQIFLTKFVSLLILASVLLFLFLKLLRWLL